MDAWPESRSRPFPAADGTDLSGSVYLPLE